ncbi:hypothetical protein NDU88_007914 [Pleurodeles waltl]|uniref:SGNH hydrolase-type esterase domain-containing protein n=1 Tax=Pleurodeles waltl TaxID=8319 RepID=A0AAV7VS56_PLEWA|nr:hypothetical protein NDU88_007914 [Pleurodeles waltl]
MQGVAFRWCGIGGGGITQRQHLVDMARGCGGLQSPDLIFIHLGGNNLVLLGRKALRETVFLELTRVAKQFPGPAFAWSHMVTRHRINLSAKRAANARGRVITRLNHVKSRR